MLHPLDCKNQLFIFSLDFLKHLEHHEILSYIFTHLLHRSSWLLFLQLTLGDEILISQAD